MSRPALVIHGGCGVLDPADLSEAGWAEARAALTTALRAGWAVLRSGGRALDAVQASVVALEDAPSFNAGHGAALNAEGEHELDASIMDGASLAAGAVAAVRRIRNPVLAARAVLDSGTLALLVGAAADRFAGDHGLALVEPNYFTTERNWAALTTMQEHAARGTLAAAREADKHGTVGAVALDADGHLAAATSTGGYTRKPGGRVGDSPIIGAGTYARDGVCAVSGTGQGEFFIRHVLGHEIASRMAYLGETLEQATAQLLVDLAPYHIGAGLIAVDAQGHVSLRFNTAGMFRGWATGDGQAFIGTHAETIAVALEEGA